MADACSGNCAEIYPRGWRAPRLRRPRADRLPGGTRLEDHQEDDLLRKPWDPRRQGADARQDPTPLPYLRMGSPWSLEINLEVEWKGQVVSRPSYR